MWRGAAEQSRSEEEALSELCGGGAGKAGIHLTVKLVKDQSAAKERGVRRGGVFSAPGDGISLSGS